MVERPVERVLVTLATALEEMIEFRMDAPKERLPLTSRLAALFIGPGLISQEMARHHRHQGAAQQIRGQHRKHHGTGERSKQVLGSPGQQQHGHENNADRECRYEGRHRNLLRPVEDCSGKRFLHAKIAMDVLHLDGCVVDENADRECEPAERHHVDRLLQKSQHNERRQDRKRDRNAYGQHAAPAAEEQQDHQPCQRGGDRCLTQD